MGEKFFVKDGFRNVLGQSGRIQCFQCKTCEQKFSTQTFSVTYRQKNFLVSSESLFDLSYTGCSLAEIARRVKCSSRLVRGRLQRLSQIALLRHTDLTKDLKLEEPLAFDGLENFAKSQYEPNHINQVLGSESYFIYDFGFAPLNRKGRMSDRQKNKRKYLDRTLGRFDPKAIRKNTAMILKRVIAKNRRLSHLKEDGRGPFSLVTDEHFQYKRAIRFDLSREERFSLHHQTVSSKLGRTFKNLLFAVNHADLLIRQHMAAFRRETIAFAKTHVRMVERYVLFMAWKNYFRVQMVKKQKRNHMSNRQSPAMALKLTDRLMNFSDFFDFPIARTQVELSKEWGAFYDGKVLFERQGT